MAPIIALCKFVGTISLGLLTGVSYTLSTQSLPSLLTLPSAKPAAYTLAQTARLATLHVRALSALATSSLLLAFALSPPRIRHPYLLWTALVAGASGALNLAMDARLKRRVVKSPDTADANDLNGLLGVSSGVNGEVEVNGEQVERTARDQQRIEFVRTVVAGLGFTMGVVGIWGDGA